MRIFGEALDAGAYAAQHHHQGEPHEHHQVGHLELPALDEVAEELAWIPRRELARGGVEQVPHGPARHHAVEAQDARARDHTEVAHELPEGPRREDSEGADRALLGRPSNGQLGPDITARPMRIVHNT